MVTSCISGRPLGEFLYVEDIAKACSIFFRIGIVAKIIRIKVKLY
tara:strand:+ start:25 stop:159 length:135 start_codon:yes stop_codon:yes gene_type:complete